MAADPNNSKQTLNQAAQGSKNSQKNAAAQAPLKAKNDKEVNKQKTQAAQQPKSQGVQGSAGQREVPCPTCNSQNVIKDRIAGKTYFKIPFLGWRVPRIWETIVPPKKSFDENVGECPICKGKRKIKDVTDDSKKYKEVQQKIEQNSKKLLETESKLGLGGTRTTFIAGSELLSVGLGFNSNKTYEAIKDGQASPDVAGKIPQASAKPSTAVVGKQGQVAWPQHSGNYTIKCANSYKLLAGAGGITLATNGPLTISAGIIRFTGPSLSLGSSTGPLTLEGDSIVMTGKHVAVAPTGGQMVVRGSVAHTGNCTTAGHTHSEGVSFVRAATVGKNEQATTDKANMDVSQTQIAVWGGAAVKGIINSILDIKLFYEMIPANYKTAVQRAISPAEMLNINDRMSTLAKMLPPFEPAPTGYILPGMCVVVGPTGTSTNPLPIPIHNFPHTHGMPTLQHTHDTKVPDMQLVDTPEQLRAQVMDGTLQTGAPADKLKDSATRLKEQINLVAALPSQLNSEALSRTSSNIILD